MALAVVLMACPAAAGKPGADGKDAEPPKLAPFKVAKIPAMPLVVGGESGMVNLSEHFSDPAGRALEYMATSSMTDYATVNVVDKMTLTVTAVAAGESTITVTATNPDKLMAKQSFMVTVAPEGMQPPMLTGEYEGIMTVSLEAGDTHRVENVAQYFTEPEDEELTISEPAVDNEKIATAEWVGDAFDVLITAVADGTAKVTVTATDEDEETVDLVITVTVEDMMAEPEPTDPTDPADPTVPMTPEANTNFCTVDVSKKCVALLDKDQNLETGDSNVVTVSKKTKSSTTMDSEAVESGQDVWEIEATGKGKVDLYVYDADDNVEYKFSVTVNNRPPQRTKAKIPTQVTLGALGDSVLPDDMGRGTYFQTVGLTLTSLFEELDDVDTISFDGKSDNTNVKVREVKGTYVVVDIIHDVRPTFDLVLWAMDDDNEKKAKSEEITVTVVAERPKPKMYSVKQYDDGSFYLAGVDYRTGSEDHTINFDPVVGTTRLTGDNGEGSLEFVSDLVDSVNNEIVVISGVTYNLLNAPSNDVLTRYPAAAMPAKNRSEFDTNTYSVGTSYLAITATTPIKKGTYSKGSRGTEVTLDGTPPSLKFSLTGRGSGKAMVTLKYMVWLDKDGVISTDADSVDKDKDQGWVTAASRVLDLSIMRVK